MVVNLYEYYNAIFFHISVNAIFHCSLLDEEVEPLPLTPLTQQDVMLSFPDNSDSEAGNEYNTSGIYSGSQEDNLSELLSASQLVSSIHSSKIRIKLS